MFIPTSQDAKVCQVLEEARSGCSTKKFQENLHHLEAQTVMKSQISSAKHDSEVKLQSTELQRAKIY